MDRIDTQDKAIQRERDDRLNRIPFVDNIIRALVIEERDLTGKVVARHSAGVVVGLVGKWGSGKSSILNILSERLRKLDHVAVATFNPWLFKGRDELLVAFFNELRDALGKNIGEEARDVLVALNRYEWAIKGAAHAGALALDLHGGGGAFTVGAKKLLKRFTKFKTKRLEPLSAPEERRSLEQKLRTKRLAVVVLIDELDRVEDDEVRAVAQLVKAVGDIKGISYLVAYDPKRVAEALGKGADPQKSGAAYLEKIIQHPIPLRPLFTDDVEALISAALEHQGVELPNDLSDNEKAIFGFIKDEITTPREIKRLIGSYAILEPMVKGEISEIDILAYCWIINKSEPLREALAANFDQAIDDPPTNTLYARHTARSAGSLTPASVLGAPAEEFDRLLRLLFPTFGTTRAGDAGNRISRRRNLVRLLYLGNPPGMMSRADVEQFWANHDIDVLAAELRRCLENGTLNALLDRLDDLLQSLDPAGDETFWPALSRALARQNDWATGPSPNGSLAEDAATYLMRFGTRSSSNALRVKRAMAALERDGDLILAPWVLRKHLFAFGMTKHRRDRAEGQMPLDETEVRDMLSRELPRYRTALRDGALIRRIPNMEALFVIANMDHWDAELREALTEQLAEPEARATLASLLVPPGYGVEPNLLDELTDAAKLLSWMNDSGQGQVGDTWLDDCLRRLRRALEGKATLGWDGSED